MCYDLSEILIFFFFRHFGDVVLHLIYKHFGRFEGRNKVFWNFNGFVALDVTTDFLGTSLNNEATETANVNVFASCKGAFYFFEESFQCDQHINFGYSCLFGDGIYQIGLSHRYKLVYNKL